MKIGWLICGTEVTVVLYNNTLTTSLLSEVAYPSGYRDGSTAANGVETMIDALGGSAGVLVRAHARIFSAG